MSYGVGILGWAHGHVGAYVNRIREMEDAVVLRSWDHDEKRSIENADNFKLKGSTHLKDVLDDKAISGVIVASETSRHAELCVAAANAGKDIALQKPMALSLKECDQIIEAVERNKVRFTMLWQMRVDPQNMKIKEVMDSGILGQILMFRRKHCLSTHTWPAFQDTWHVKKELNRGMWFDDASHPFDLVRWMFGKPRSVMAEIDTLVNPRVPDDNGIAVFRAESGAIVEVFSSFTANAGETTTEIHGDKGSLIQLYGDGVSCGTPRAGEVPALRWLLNGETAWTDSGIPAPSGGHGIRIADLSRPLVDFFLGNRAPIATVYEGRDVVEMLLASYESARIGKRILFPFS